MIGMLKRKAEKHIINTRPDRAQEARGGLTPAMTRVVLVTGKGGVGKTTTAAATAVRAARSGLRTLVMSTDAAHSLGDALDVDLTTAAHLARDDRGRAGAARPRRRARTPPSRPTGRSCATTCSGCSTRWVSTPSSPTSSPRCPGAEEVTALAALAHQAESGSWDLVVVDCAPTAETLRLLALPEVLGWHLDRLLPAQRRLLTVLRPAASAATGVPVPGPEVLLVLRAWRELMVGVRALLTSARASVRVVLTPERVVIAESRRVLTSLSLHGYAVDAVVVNRLLPDALPGDVDPWRTAWTTAQASGLEQVRESFLGIPLLCAPYLAGEPIGADALDALAVARRSPTAGPAPALMDDVDVPRMRVEADGADFVLTLPLPLVSAGHGRHGAPRGRPAPRGRRPAPGRHPARRCCAGASSAMLPWAAVSCGCGSSVTRSCGPVGAERWDEQVGSVADEAARLLESLRRSAAEAAARPAAGEDARMPLGRDPLPAHRGVRHGHRCGRACRCRMPPPPTPTAPRHDPFCTLVPAVPGCGRRPLAQPRDPDPARRPRDAWPRRCSPTSPGSRPSGRATGIRRPTPRRTRDRRPGAAGRTRVPASAAPATTAASRPSRSATPTTRRRYPVADGSLAIGIDIGGTKVAGGVVDADGNRAGPRPARHPAPVDDPARRRGHHRRARRGAARAVAPTTSPRSASGPPASSRPTGPPSSSRRTSRGATSRCARPSGSGCPLPIFVDNDANAAVWAEYRFGAGRGESHLVMVNLGTGIGGGIVLDGRVIRGRYGIAGEFGHMQVVPDGIRCECGNKGCWEQYASGNALVREARGADVGRQPGRVRPVRPGRGPPRGPHRPAGHRGRPRRRPAGPRAARARSASGSASASPTSPPPSTPACSSSAAASAPPATCCSTRPATRSAASSPAAATGPRPRSSRRQLGNEAGLVGAADLARTDAVSG